LNPKVTRPSCPRR